MSWFQKRLRHGWDDKIPLQKLLLRLAAKMWFANVIAKQGFEARDAEKLGEQTTRQRLILQFEIHTMIDVLVWQTQCSTYQILLKQGHHHKGARPHMMCSICGCRFATPQFGGTRGSGSAHTVARPCIPISSILTHYTYGRCLTVFELFS